jgi:two-component system, chemotaxis family, chemotaxis protein CheY
MYQLLAHWWVEGIGGLMSVDPLSEICVMIVDDQRAMRMIIRRLLGQVNIENVIEAEDGREALDYLMHPSNETPDIVICDLHMANIDGLEFSNLVRRNKVPKLAGIPILILTGDHDTFMHEVTQQAGATKVLTKPISAPDLRNEIAAAIGFG